ncbi:hypothetical protein [Streptomyces sp. NBC_01579]|uniref:hypothetical protein n=1 Tax=Streptomyces sp. NBC_01579 TaxID=2975885 RepID=UPI0038709EAF
MGQHHPFSFRRSCSFRSSRSGLRAAIGAIALLALVALMVPAGPTAAADHRQPPSADPAAIRDWNAIATETISANLGPTRPSGQVAVWHGFVSAAVYNAVVGIQGNYAPYKWRESGPATASPEASAVTAAHHILLALFPASQAQLDTEYAASLAEIPSGPAKDQGVAFGARASSTSARATAVSWTCPSPSHPHPASGAPRRPPGCPSSTPGSADSGRSCSPPPPSSVPASRPPCPQPATPGTRTK